MAIFKVCRLQKPSAVSAPESCTHGLCWRELLDPSFSHTTCKVKAASMTAISMDCRLSKPLLMMAYLFVQQSSGWEVLQQAGQKAMERMTSRTLNQGMYLSMRFHAWKES